MGRLIRYTDRQTDRQKEKVTDRQINVLTAGVGLTVELIYQNEGLSLTRKICKVVMMMKVLILVHSFFRCVLASLYEVVSVGRSVRWSVTRFFSNAENEQFFL